MSTATEDLPVIHMNDLDILQIDNYYDGIICGVVKWESQLCYLMMQGYNKPFAIDEHMMVATTYDLYKISWWDKIKMQFMHFDKSDNYVMQKEKVAQVYWESYS